MRTLFILLAVVALCSARAHRSRSPIDFVGLATNELSTAIFQSYIDDNKNIAFSPLGFSAILAILAEGASGETKEQLATALHLPDDPAMTRRVYHYILDRLKNTHEYKYNQPELKNFFYIYKNYTINDDYKNILEKYYLTEVRSVERYNPEEHLNSEESDPNSKAEITVDLPDKKPEDNNNIPELMPPKESQEQLISFAVEDKPEKINIAQPESIPAKNIKEKIKLVKTSPKKEDSKEDEETLVAVEARNHGRSLKVLEDKNDITSSISVNSVGKKSNKAKVSHPLMIIFNGMYFRGSWKKPWDSVEPSTFYLSNTEKIQVPMMKTTGVFKTVTLPEFDLTAIELPYDGDRYSLVLVLPEARDGLRRLVDDLPAISLDQLQDSMREEHLTVSVPTFYVEITTKPVVGIAKFGVPSIFTPEAQLSGVSEVEGLFVQELVQHVAVRVDQADSSASQMSVVSPVESLKTLSLTKSPGKFCVERPFLFFIVDRLDKFIVVAGKVTDPKQQTDFHK